MDFHGRYQVNIVSSMHTILPQADENHSKITPASIDRPISNHVSRFKAEKFIPRTRNPDRLKKLIRTSQV
jgi:hypothetical protein